MRSEITFSQIKAAAQTIRQEFGRPIAIYVIQSIGKANSLAEMSQRHYPAFMMECQDMIAMIRGPSGELYRATRRMELYSLALIQARDTMSQASDNLKAAVDGAATEMARAADFIRNHSSASQDAEMQAMADKLTGAAKALSGVDVDTAVAEAAAESKGG